MKIYQKILVTTLSIALVALLVGSWITYSLSRQALDLMAERWLDTRLNEAVHLVTRHEEFLRLYGITNIRAGTLKAQFDAMRELSNVQIGNHGYIYLIDHTGTIVLHPDPKLIGTDITGNAWAVPMLKDPKGTVSYRWSGETHLAMYSFFEPWGWIVVATDPLDEIYGPMNNARNYLLLLAIIGSLGIALFTVIQARRIVIPLQLLVKGTQQVGRGNLNVTIPVTSSDEIGHLSRAFNAMSHDLSTSLTALKQSEKYFRALTENSSDLITLLTPDGNIRYLSPSITGLLGYRSRGLMGQPLSSIMDTDSSPKFDRFLIRLQQSENETLSEEFVFLNRAEEARIFEISARNLTSVPGVGGLVLNSRDITTRKQIEDELKTSELQLHHLSSQLISAQEDERKRLSVELHDEVGQSLAVLKLKIIFFEESLDSGDQSGKKECEAMVAFIDQLIENVRRLSHDLAPTAIEDLGLSAALMWLIDTIKKHYTITTDISLGELDNLLSLDRQILVYRIFQEAIANAVKHANATRLIMTGRLESNALFFKIEDNGKGFVRNQTDPDSREKTGIGIATMQERVRMLGGNLVIKSAEGSGAVLQFTIPVDTSRSHGHL